MVRTKTSGLPRVDKKFWFWYVAHDDELMIDCDGATLLQIAMKRLERATRPPDNRKGLALERGLQVRGTWVAPSQSADHFHLCIRLAEPMDVLERMVWQLYFFDHVFRSVKNLFRTLDGVSAPSLLISPTVWEWCHDNAEVSITSPNGSLFWRTYDAVCDCKNHKDRKKILTCPAHVHLRGVAEGEK